MIIKDYTNEYINKILSGNNLASYKNVFPELFEHYFSYWAQENLFKPILSKEEVSDKKNLILKELPFIEEKLNLSGLNTSATTIILFVGQNCTNGHSFKYRDSFITWVPIEAYNTPEQVRVFITHEILHSFHYTSTPEFYFNSIQEKDSFLRQLSTEGISTYLTKNILSVSDGQALWADYIQIKEVAQWLKQCNQQYKELYKYALEATESEKIANDFFQANNPNDIYKYRAGYYLGLKIIENIIKDENITNDKLLNFSRNKLNDLILKDLKEKSAPLS